MMKIKNAFVWINAISHATQMPLYFSEWCVTNNACVLKHGIKKLIYVNKHNEKNVLNVYVLFLI